MATNGDVRGNLLKEPELKPVNVGGESRQICELRVMSDVWREDANGDLEQDDKRTHPVQITVWNESLAKQCFAVLRKGMRIEARGQLVPHAYHYSDAERATGKQDIFELRMTAESVGLCLNRIESVQMRAPRAQTGDVSRMSAPQGEGISDDIPY